MAQTTVTKPGMIVKDEHKDEKAPADTTAKDEKAAGKAAEAPPVADPKASASDPRLAFNDPSQGLSDDDKEVKAAKDKIDADAAAAKAKIDEAAAAKKAKAEADKA